MTADEPIRDSSDLTPAWLTAALAASGALEHGAVESFAVEHGGGNWSANARLRLRYTPDARGERPERLFLKLVRTDLGDGESASRTGGSGQHKGLIDGGKGCPRSPTPHPNVWNPATEEHC